MARSTKRSRRPVRSARRPRLSLGRRAALLAIALLASAILLAVDIGGVGDPRALLALVVTIVVLAIADSTGSSPSP